MSLGASVFAKIYGALTLTLIIYHAEINLYKPWGKGLFQFEIIINVIIT